jgi:hypothetical protein
VSIVDQAMAEGAANQAGTAADNYAHEVTLFL